MKLNRKEELMKVVNKSNETIAEPLIDKVLFLENQLESLEKLPMIKVNPNNPEQQKATQAARRMAKKKGIDWKTGKKIK